jgi:hypothetical protein
LNPSARAGGKAQAPLRLFAQISFVGSKQPNVSNFQNHFTTQSLSSGQVNIRGLFSWLGISVRVLKSALCALLAGCCVSYFVIKLSSDHVIKLSIMTRLSNALVFLSIAGSFVTGQQYDQEKQNKDATCNVGFIVSAISR